MISKELKSQLSILKETNPEYIQTQFYRRRGTTQYRTQGHSIKNTIWSFL